ncbi:MAG: TIGR01620 family protein [Rhodobacteraceae bacterium]|nr:TIGR01620 family protein [Paracoccaceae bacterium]
MSEGPVNESVKDPTKGPVIIDLEAEGDGAPNVADAPPVPDLAGEVGLADPVAAERALALAQVRPSPLAKWFWGLLLAVISAAVGVAAWDFALGLLQRWPLFGMVVTGAFAVLVLVALVLSLRELAGLARLRRIDGLRAQVDDARDSTDMEPARKVCDALDRFYRGRGETRWGRARLAERRGEILDADALLDLAEDEVLAPLDQAALREVEKAARQVATVTALVPLALADVMAVLLSSLRMIRAVATLYGGRSGLLGSWRLLRAVMTHLAATGAVAVGDDLLEPVLGGSVLGKLSRRFGEGLVNGALTARVGIAAMEVCRPMPFSKRHHPSVKGVIKRALTGLFKSEA